MEAKNINIEAKNGKVILSSDVFKNIAQIASNKVSGIFPAKKEDDFVSCKLNNDNVKLTIFIKLKQGSDVSKVCSQLQNKIHEDILDMTGIDCNEINLDIQGFTSDK